MKRGNEPKEGDLCVFLDERRLVGISNGCCDRSRH